MPSPREPWRRPGGFESAAFAVAIVAGILLLHATAVPAFARWMGRPLGQIAEWLVPSAAAASNGSPRSARAVNSSGDPWKSSTGDDPTSGEENDSRPFGASITASPSRARRSPQSRPDARRTMAVADTRSIYVTRKTVEQFLEAHVNPSGRSIAASPNGPAGVEVTNPDGLRRLVRAGDIITDVEGRETPTIEDLIAAVGGAQQRHASRVSGHVVRDGQRWSVTVEAPW